MKTLKQFDLMLCTTIQLTIGLNNSVFDVSLLIVVVAGSLIFVPLAFGVCFFFETARLLKMAFDQNVQK